uniref:Endoglucanase n=1 Tax=Auxenochlorella protothecoides TaxID=3075 RepID=A0A1D1ZW54_AUXPR
MSANMSSTPSTTTPPAAFPLYTEAFNASWLFYEAQISGPKPPWSRIKYRGDAHLDDAVPGGWYDAGDHLKLNFPLGQAVSFLAWAALDFPEAFAAASPANNPVENIRLAAQYLMDCHVGKHEYVGQIGDPDIDHDYWGRPEEQRGSRPAFRWTLATPASDLLGSVAAALAASHLLLKGRDEKMAAELLRHAEELYAWAKEVQGKYNAAHKGATHVYQSSRFLDKLMYAAAWLFRATGQGRYADDALAHWRAAGGSGDVVTSWDSLSVPALNLLLGLAAQGKAVPGKDEYEAWFQNNFLSAWFDPRSGHWDMKKSPKGLIVPGFADFGNLRYACNAAFMMALRASYSPSEESKALAWCRQQLDYVLWSTGRSFVVGVGSGYPLRPHHRAASIPAAAAGQGRVWQYHNSPDPNPHVLTGALVGGPVRGDDGYEDARPNFRGNEVAVDFNAGYTGALAGVLAMESRSLQISTN